MMAADKAVTAAAWAKAEAQYADRTIKVSEIAKALGLSAIALSNEAKKRGWPLRTGRLAAGSSLSSRLPTPLRGAGRKARTKIPPAPMVLVRRVYNTIDGELTKLEQQKGASSQDRERASRALSQMVNSLEKAVEMQREITKSISKRSGAKDKEALAHAEDLRRAIAERLERLHLQRSTARRAVASE